MLDDLLEEIARLKQAEKLLEEIYQELGPYVDIHEGNREAVGVRYGKLTFHGKLWNDVRNFFDFDDSE